VFGCVVNVVISKAGHGEVTVIIIWLIPDIDALLLSDILRRGSEVLRQQLLLFVEIVPSALSWSASYEQRRLRDVPRQ